ncbi:MAG: hypothetical protein RLZZ536_3098 [Planctomycetota bacterium]
MRMDVCVVCFPEVCDAAKIPGEVAGRYVEGSRGGCGHGLRWCGDLASAGVVWRDVTGNVSGLRQRPEFYLRAGRIWSVV